MGTNEEKSRGYQPTYRQKDVDKTLGNHEHRLTRLERLMYVLIGAVFGIGVKTAPNEVIDLVFSLL